MDEKILSASEAKILAHFERNVHKMAKDILIHLRREVSAKLRVSIKSGQRFSDYDISGNDIHKLHYLVEYFEKTGMLSKSVKANIEFKFEFEDNKHVLEEITIIYNSEMMYFNMRKYFELELKKYNLLLKDVKYHEVKHF